jgi:hypothetical protein
MCVADFGLTAVYYCPGPARPLRAEGAASDSGSGGAIAVRVCAGLAAGLAEGAGCGGGTGYDDVVVAYRDGQGAG